MTDLTAELARELLDYDHETGVFRWRVSGSRTRVGAVAGGRHTEGYWTIGVRNRQYFAHRLAWLVTYGRWPSEVDHINRDRLDNRIVNLREVSRTENSWNREYRGYYWSRAERKWKAQIVIHGEHRFLGTFDNEADARVAANTAREKRESMRRRR
jgi:HNH endonuclease